MSIFTAMRGLKALLVAQAAIAEASIGYPAGGVERQLTLNGHAVWLSLSGEDSTETHEPAVSDLSASELTYEIPVRIVVKLTTDDLEDAIEAAEPLIDAVMTAVASDRTLGGSVVYAYVVRQSADEAGDENWRGIGATVTVTCREYVSG